MADNRLLSESDLWFSPSQMKEGAKNALLYPFRNPEQTAEFGLSMAPGSGEAMSARDAWDASGRAGNALLSGNYGQAASEYGNVATGLLGALPGAGIIARGTKRGAAWMDRNLPTGVNKLLDSITPQASQDTLYAIPAWHGSPHDFDKFDMSKAGTGGGGNARGHGVYLSEDRDFADIHRRVLSNPDQGTGRLYRTEINAEPSDLMDWDKPIGQQNQNVQTVLKKLAGGDLDPDQTVDDLMFSLNIDRPIDQRELSKMFIEAGVPGVRFVKQNPDGRDVVNYAVFDDNLVKILGKE